MAVALYGQGQFAQALETIANLLERYPDSEVLHNTAGAVNAGLGRLDTAVAHYDKAIALAPDYFEALNNRGIALQNQGCVPEALASFDRAIGLNPGYTKAHVNRGLALGKLKRLDEALACFDLAIRLEPALAEAYSNKGNVLLTMNRPCDALAHFDKAIALKGNLASAHVNRGNALIALKRWDEAVVSYDRSIALAPGDAMAFRNRGIALHKLKRPDEALASYRRAHQIAPDSARDLAEVRYLEAHLCIWNDGNGFADVPADMAVPPFYMLRFEDNPQKQMECARAWCAEQYGAIVPAEVKPHASGGKIRIGYFSADFHNHATMYLMARLFELHDKSRFEIHAFSYGPDVQDEMRLRLINAVDAFHQVERLDDEAAARLAREAEIDIAIDLKGHTENARPGIFAYRAAPVQAQYLGYPGTMGAEFIDYIIADPVTIPPHCERFYTEQVVRLPHSYQVNDDRRAISDRIFTRAELGLPEDGFVFCCFNNNYKITPSEFDIWMRLLSQIEGSVLWLFRDNAPAAENLRGEAAKRGVAPERLVFADRMPQADHLARQRCADLFLDTFAFNAHTTASDALWSGLPLVTRLGQSFAARVAGSLLHAVDLPELTTETPEAYEALALKLAADPAALAAVKAKLAINLSTSPLFDTAQFTRDIETVYERLHA
ncbi:MAG: tetratricopeptide repeat protein [Novosphingobium sp.]